MQDNLWDCLHNSIRAEVFHLLQDRVLYLISATLFYWVPDWVWAKGKGGRHLFFTILLRMKLFLMVFSRPAEDQTFFSYFDDFICLKIFYLFSSVPPVTRSNAQPVTRLPTRRSVQPLTKRFVLFSFFKSDWTIFNFSYPNFLGLFLWSWRIRWIRKTM